LGAGGGGGGGSSKYLVFLIALEYLQSSEG
jgi:hypothetical protein